MLAFNQSFAAKELLIVVGILFLFVVTGCFGYFIAERKGYNPWIGFVAGTCLLSVLIFPLVLTNTNKVEGDDRRRATRRNGHVLMLIVCSAWWLLVVFLFKTLT